MELSRACMLDDLHLRGFSVGDAGVFGGLALRIAGDQLCKVSVVVAVSTTTSFSVFAVPVHTAILPAAVAAASFPTRSIAGLRYHDGKLV